MSNELREAFSKVVFEADRDWNGNVSHYRRYLVDRLTDSGLFRLAAAPLGDVREALEAKATIVTCCVTGAVAGDGGACGDCDPCIFGEASVPDAVKRLIAEKNSLIQCVGELEDKLSAPAGGVGEEMSQRESDIGILLSALRFHEDAVGETFDDDGGTIAQIETDYKNRQAALVAKALAPQNAGGESSTSSDGPTSQSQPVVSDQHVGANTANGPSEATPGMNWELSEETKRHLSEIDDNRRHAMANIGNLIVGAPSESTPAPAKCGCGEFCQDLGVDSGCRYISNPPAPADDAAVPQLEPWRIELDEIVIHLSAAVAQSIATDDQIIMDHVKAAHEIAKIVRRKA